MQTESWQGVGVASELEVASDKEWASAMGGLIFLSLSECDGKCSSLATSADDTSNCTKKIEISGRSGPKDLGNP